MRDWLGLPKTGFSLKWQRSFILLKWFSRWSFPLQGGQCTYFSWSHQHPSKNFLLIRAGMDEGKLGALMGAGWKWRPPEGAIWCSVYSHFSALMGNGSLFLQVCVCTANNFSEANTSIIKFPTESSSFLFVLSLSLSNVLLKFALLWLKATNY